MTSSSLWICSLLKALNIVSLTIPSSSIILKESWVMPFFKSFSLKPPSRLPLKLALKSPLSILITWVAHVKTRKGNANVTVNEREHECERETALWATVGYYKLSIVKSTSYLKRVSNGPIEACCMSAYLLEVTFRIPRYTLAMNNN